LIIKKTVIEAISKHGEILKRTYLSSGTQFMNRKIAVNNSLYNAEKKRVLFDKPLLDCPFQACALHWDLKKKMWRMSSLKEAESHAEQLGRIFLAYHQLTQENWETLNWGNFLS
jgi:hypothetical protein